MVDTSQDKISKVADSIPQLELIGGEDADMLVVGWGGTYGHLREAVEKMNADGHKVALAHFRFISPLPNNAASILRKFTKVVVAEQNNGQFAGYLMEKIPGLQVDGYNKVEGMPFSVSDLIESFTKKLEE